MSIRLWSYDPDKCENEPCIGNCYICSKADDGEHLPVEAVLAMLSEQINKKGASDESKAD